ncbi:flavin reductase [Agrobacterium leguminum]|uniref:flavin reductase n=1 Tax=Agrobacterium leguminum TaxID=2792015 RepID=UPI003CE4B096
MFVELTPGRAYRLLKSGPVALVSTRGTDGQPNLMTMGVHMMIRHDPPLVGAVLANGPTAIVRSWKPANAR